MEDDFFCYLDISCWAGISIGAEHHYGKIVCHRNGEYTRVDVLHPLTGKEALYLNKKSVSSGFSLYRKGENDNRFMTEAEVIRWAKKIWKKEFPNAVCLVRGDAACGCNPHEILVGPEPYKSLVNQLASEYDRIEWHEREPEYAEQLCNNFRKLKKVFMLTQTKKRLKSKP